MCIDNYFMYNKIVKYFNQDVSHDFSVDSIIRKSVEYDLYEHLNIKNLHIIRC